MILHKHIREKNIGVSKDTASIIARYYCLKVTIHKEENILDNVMHQLLECNHDIKCINECLKHVGPTELMPDEVGQVLGITRERVCQIEFAALRTLKSPHSLRKLRAYLMM